MKSPSERVVAAVIKFIAGTHMHSKPRPSTYSLFSASRNLSRQVRDFDRRCEEVFGRK